AEFLHNEVPGISIPDEVRERIRGKEGAEGEKIGLEVARQVAGELLSHFRGVYLITPFLRYELTAQLCRWVRASQPAAAAARAGA
ncbi:MAG: bifunctional homocysteine S-methyltransferase/methylenetetrahydrofolate reductase, partial [Verrucomicrobiae bacterium]|nr:bifunctional homocysteine S-methyltransferase/methylenetetrahydrofolate reductase [Verrucomicrobiae bacterium]